MRFIEIFEQLNEGIPMGKKALNTPTKKNYTFGAELELYVNPDYIVSNITEEDAVEELKKLKRLDYIVYNISQTINSKYPYSSIIDMVKQKPEQLIDIMLEVGNFEKSSDTKNFNPKKYFNDQPFSDTIKKIETYSTEDMQIDDRKEFLIELAKIKHLYFEKRGNIDQLQTVVNKLSDDETNTYIDQYIKTVNKLLDDNPPEDKDDPYSFVNDEQFGLFDMKTTLQNNSSMFYRGIKNGILAFLKSMENRGVGTFSVGTSESDQAEFTEYLQDDVETYINEYGTDAFDYVKDYFGPHVKVEDVVPDSSLQDYDLEGVELIIGVYQDQNSFLSDLKKSFDMMKSNEAITTSSDTGLHINIGTFSKEEIKNIDLLKFLLILEGDRILKEFGREFNDYTQSMGDTIGKTLQFALENGDIRQYDMIKDQISRMIRRKASKYDMVNLSKLFHGGIIEVRAFGNEDYEYHFDLVEKNIKRVLRALEIAQDGNAYRKEYLKKLSRYVKSDDRIPPKVHEALTKFGNVVGAASPEYQTYSYQSPYILHLLYVFQKSRDNGDFEKLEENWNPIIGAYYVKLLTIDTRKNLSTIKNANDRLRQYINDFEVEKFAPKLVAELKKYKMI